MDNHQSRATNEPIAVIGSGCRLPGGASSPSKLWELLSNPRDVLKEISNNRFNPHGFYNSDGEYHGHSNVKHSYLLEEDHRVFDADFFGVSANEAVAIDPQQRLLLETVYEALEAAGLPLDAVKGTDTAVYVGLMTEEYSVLQLRELNMLPTYFPTGTARSVVSNRISYVFDWHGHSMTIDTACSSSLVAVHLAVQALRNGETQLAVAAGTNLILAPEPYIAESTFHMLSPQGRSHMWDSRADGYGRGEGTAAVILKRLSDALAAGDNIDYVIRETGVNQDGRTKGITVPSPDAQVDLIKSTYARAGLDLALHAPQFFEAHGTGTPTGDPLEAEAIHRSMGQRQSGGSKLIVGSIKTVVGHTEGTAGLAGLLKAGLALQHRKIPPNMLFKNLNPAVIPFYENLEIPTKLVDWPEVPNGHPRRASVNSFGFGGTNTHAIVESYECSLSTLDSVRCRHFLGPVVFSANSKASLKRYLKAMAQHLARNPNLPLPDLAYTLSERRSVLSFRIAFAAGSTTELQDQLARFAEVSDKESPITRTAVKGKILGIFTGQGAQWAGMGRELIQEIAWVRRGLHRLEAYLEELPLPDRPSWSLREELLANETTSRLSNAAVSQPLCTAVQILLVDLLHAAGVQLSAVVGHSSGEIACAYAAGVLSARDAIVVAYYRGLHSELAGSSSGQPGAMMAVETSPEDADDICSLPQFSDRLCVAACNSPESITLSGDADAIQEAKVIFDDEGKFARQLRVDKAYHSQHMMLCSEPYYQSLRNAGVHARTPSESCKWYSSVLEGGLVEENVAREPLSGRYWCDNLTGQVKFASALQAALKASSMDLNIVLEVGPHGALKKPILDTIKAIGRAKISYVSCMTRNQDCRKTFTGAIGELWKNGAEAMLSFPSLEKQLSGAAGSTYGPKLVRDLPTYQWDHDRVFWHESRRSKLLRSRSEPGHNLLGTLSPDSTESDLLWHNVIKMSSVPWLSGHAVQGQLVFPAAGYVALAIEAALRAPGFSTTAPSLIEIRDVDIGRAITFADERSAVEMLFSLHVGTQESTPDKSRVITTTFRVHSSSGEGTTIFNAGGQLVITYAASEEIDHIPMLPRQGDAPEYLVEVNEEEFYSRLAQLGYEYSGPFKALSKIVRKCGEGRGYVKKPEQPADYNSSLLVHPGLLDATFQSVFLALSFPGDGALWTLHVPVSIERLVVDVAAWMANTDTHLAFDAQITSSSAQSGMVGEIGMYSKDGGQGLLQLEGFRAVPLAGATAQDDIDLLFESQTGVAFPDGSLAVGDDVATEEETAVAWLMERISCFYLRQMTRDITREQEASAAWHHQLFMEYARHVAAEVSAGRHPYGKKEWMVDTKESLATLMEPYKERVEVRLACTVGENIKSAILGETHIIAPMRQDGLLDEYYAHDLGIAAATEFLAEVMGQIVHVYPHMQILEIGAGTGGATKRVLPRIGPAFDHYTFTDISAGYFETARDVFAEYEQRMDFRVLDLEKDVGHQGFEEHSFDLIIASLVLHATKDLKQTLQNVRKLLRPGGYLVATETTNISTIRATFLMGGLDGWWLGAESGRQWSPNVTSAEWHSLMLDAGFTGIETSTPERDALARPCSVLVTRASNEYVDVLAAPSMDASPLSAIDRLLIITGSSLEAVRAARSICRRIAPHCPDVKVVSSFAELSEVDLRGPPTVLNLSDWEEPLFQDLTTAAFQGLQLLFSHVETLMWVTRGCRRDQPYANVSHGFVRALARGNAQLSIRIIDFESDSLLQPSVLVDELLRQTVLHRADRDGVDLLWNAETEMTVDARGCLSVERVKPSKYFNNCYNAARRNVEILLDPKDTPVRLTKDGQWARYSPPGHSLATEHGVLIRPLYSSGSCIRLTPDSMLYPCVGIEADSGRMVMALASDMASAIHVPPEHTAPFPCDSEEALVLLVDLANGLRAEVIVKAAAASPHGTILVVEPSLGLARALARVAARDSLSVVCVTASVVKMTELKGLTGLRLVHPRASSSALRRQLPRGIAYVVDMADGSLLSRRLYAAIDKDVRMENFTKLSFHGSLPQIWHRCIQQAKSSAPLPGPSHVLVQQGQEFSTLPRDADAVLDWSGMGKIAVPINYTDAIPSLRGDRTYLLIGLAGRNGLGISIVEFMIRQGAKHVVLTSRRPSPNQKWIDHYASQGVKIQIIANDVTDEDAVRSLVRHIRTTGPPIAGVANAALVLHDSMFLTMTYEQMTDALRPKVEGSRILDEIFWRDDLDFFIMFSSLASTIGAPGQVNYAAANMYMLSLAEQRRQRGVAASCIDLGMVVGVGYLAREGTQQAQRDLSQAGFRSMSERDVHFAFGAAIQAGQVGSRHPTDMMTGLVPSQMTGSYLQSWTKLPRFGHVARTQAAVANSARAKSAAAIESARSLLLRARTQEDVVHVVQGTVLLKLQQMLQLSAEITADQDALLQQSTDALGVDSLVAVELRTWLLREIEVDIPVLTMLGELSVQALIDCCVQRLSPEMLPMLGHEGSADLPPTFLGQPIDNQAPSSPSPPHSPGEQVQGHRNLDSDSDSRQESHAEFKDMAESLDSLRASSSIPTSAPRTSRSSSVSVSDISSAASPGDKHHKSHDPSYHRTAPPSDILTTLTVERTLPMSWGQSRFWIMSQVVQDPAAFNVTARLEITGRLDIAALAKAVELVGWRHQAMRTAFFANDEGQPMQRVLNEGVLKLEVLPPTSTVQEHFTDLHRHIYDLANAKAMRVLLYNTSTTSNTLLIGYSHINMDSTSLGVFVGDICRSYMGEALPQLSLQYPDFSELQKQRLQDGHWREHMAFWRGEFESPLPPLPRLHISHRSSKPRPILNQYRQLSCSVQVSEPLARQIVAASRKIRATPFHIYLAVFQTLLARLAETDTVVIGMADANRSVVPGAAECIGNLLNLVPLRLETRMVEPFSTLVKLAKQKVLSALSHSEVPLDVIMNEIRVERSASHSPMFQSFIDYRRESEKLTVGSGPRKITIEGKQYALSGTPYDVMLDIIDKQDGAATLNMLVHEALYTKEEGELLLRSYVHLLSTLTANLDVRVGDATIWDKRDIESALALGRGEMFPLEHHSFLAELDGVAESQPGALAVKDSDGGQVTYSQLVSQTQLVAHSLMGLTLGRGARVGVLLQPTVDWMVAMTGIWRGGFSYVPLEVTQGLPRLAQIVREANLAVVVVNGETSAMLAGIGWSSTSSILNMDHLGDLSESASKALPPQADSEGEAMVMFTSGSTGTPKGIAIPHRVVTNALKSFLHRFPLPPQTVLAQTPISFDMSWWTALMGLATRGTVVVAAQTARRDPLALTRLISRESITFTFAVPSESASWIQNANLDELRSSKWSFHCSAGEALPWNLVDQLQRLGKHDLRAVNAYGPTETMIPTVHEIYYPSMSPADMPVPIGQVLPNYNVYIVDQQGQPVPAGVPGHLVVSGAGIATGYVNDEPGSTQRFPLDQLVTSDFLHRGWTHCHLTGDRCYLDKSDGLLVMQGRIDGDTQIKLRGFRMDVLDIEAHLVAKARGNISQTIVHAYKPDEDDTSTHYLVAHVVLSDQGRLSLPSEPEQKAFLTRVTAEMSLPDYMRPSRLIVVESLPLTPHGKVDRRSIAKWCPTDEERLSSEQIKTENYELATMAAIWKRVLGEAVTPFALAGDTDFFAVGGNSLLLIRARAEIETETGVDLALPELFQHSTLAGMAGLIESKIVDKGIVAMTPTINWEEETILDDGLQRFRVQRDKALTPGNIVVALTGTTGFLGKSLLKSLVQSPEVSRIHCLAVRDATRLRNFTSPKIVVYKGDLSQPGLGLTPSEAHNVFTSASVVIHNGADTSFMKSYSTLKAVNLTSTRELARLSLEYGPISRFHYVSTAGIASQLQRDLYDESLGPMPAASDGAQGYVYSKWASEVFLERLSRAAGLPLTIHRPTAIIGPGAPQLDVMSSVLRFSELLGMVPRMDGIEGHFQFVDVNRVAKDMLRSIVREEATPPLVRYQNHCGPPEDTVSIPRLGEYLCRKLERPVTTRSDAEWIQRARQAGLPAEVAAYLEDLGAAFKATGKKWIFPHVWNGTRSEH